ncbi:hypothetical protein LJR084_007658 [Variovorax sp. LjRoot84]
MRTALALLAGAVLFDQVATRVPDQTYVPALAVAASIVSSGMCVLAFRRWKANEIAMRHDRPLPSSIFLAVIAFVFMIAAAIVAIILARHL